MKTEEQMKTLVRQQRDLIQNADDMPAYKVLQRIIQGGIEQGDWKPGDLLPTERQFAQFCELSVGTVKKTMQNLVSDGFVYRRQGSGTYVSGSSLNRQMRRYYLFLKDFGAEEGSNAIALHSARLVSAIPEVSRNLQLLPGANLCEVMRIFVEESGTSVLCKSYFASTTVPDLEKKTPNRFEHVPLFVILEEDYNLVCTRSDELFCIVENAEEERSILNIDSCKPILMIKTINFDRNNNPFEYRLSYCNTNKKGLYRTTQY